MFEDIFNQFFPNNVPFNQFGAASPPSGANAPPASRRLISSLPQVKVTADDLLEATNKECLICLDEQKLGSYACKLQCGHLFHKNCLIEWLERHCTCPVCRFELETDDPQYEADRKKRMKNRKLRLRMDELKAKSISQIKEIARNLSINISDCFDKSEMVDRIAKSGKIIITEGVPLVRISQKEFLSKTVGELNHMLLSYGISKEGAIEKSDLRARLLDSGRIEVFQDESDSKEGGEEEHYGNAPSPARSPVYHATQHSTPNSNFTLVQLNRMSVSELKALCSQHMVDIRSCSDKREIIDSIRSCSSITVAPMLEMEEDDFLSKSCAELRELLRSFGMSADHVDDLSELRVRLLDAGRIEIVTHLGTMAEEKMDVEERRQQELWEKSQESKMVEAKAVESRSDDQLSYAEQLRGLSISRLKALCSRHALDIRGCFDKMDIVDRILSSTRADQIAAELSGGRNRYSNSGYADSSGNGGSRPRYGSFVLSRETIDDMSIEEIQSILSAFHEDFQGCTTRRDFIGKLEASQHIRVV